MNNSTQRFLDCLYPETDARTPAATYAAVVHGVEEIRVTGFADLEHGVRADSATRFHLASLAKQFTAFLVAEAIADGLWALDSPIGQMLTELQAPTASCTVGQLLFHTAGLRDHWALGDFAGLRDGDSITTADALGWIASQSALNFPSGSRFSYSNSGYVLLALGLERLRDTDFPTLARQRIFAPLGMADTQFADDPCALIPNRAHGYAKIGAKYVASDPHYGVIGATCLRSTAHDMLRWLGTPADDPFFGAVTKVGYFERGTLGDGTPIPYGFGQLHRVVDGHPIAFHAGYDYGFNAIGVRNLDTHDAYFCATGGSVGDLDSRVLAWLGFEVPDCQANASGNAPAPLEPGVYVDEGITDMRRVSTNDGALFLEWPGRFALKPCRYGWWLEETQIAVQAVACGTISIGNGSTRSILRRVNEEEVELAELTGVYFSRELGSTMAIGREPDGQFAIRLGRRASVVIEPLNRELARFGQNWIRFLRHGSGVVGAELSHPRCTGVPFRRLGG